MATTTTTTNSKVSKAPAPRSKTTTAATGLSSPRPKIRIRAGNKLTASLRSGINKALIQRGQVQRIHETLLQALSQSGWIDDVRSRCVELLREDERGQERLMERIREEKVLGLLRDDGGLVVRKGMLVVKEALRDVLCFAGEETMMTSSDGDEGRGGR